MRRASHSLVIELEILFFEPKETSVAAVLLFANGLQNDLQGLGPTARHVRWADKNRHSIITQVAAVDERYAPRGFGGCRNGCRVASDMENRSQWQRNHDKRLLATDNVMDCATPPLPYLRAMVISSLSRQ